MRTPFGWAMFFPLLLSGNANAADCALSKQYLTQAQEKIASSATDEAAYLLRQSIDACPSYDAYETLAELQAKSPNQWDRAHAADAFVAAHARAKSATARAQTLFQYASLLNQEGDPQNAYPLIKKARALDPARTEIGRLADTIEAQIQNPQKEQITRALRFSFYKPLNAAVPLPKLSTSIAGSPANAAVTNTEPPGSAPVAAPGMGGGSVNIPINFEFSSTTVDEKTRPNITTLSKALADSSLQGSHFLFIGHSDSSGDENFNVALSLKRADAIRQSIIEMEPTLKGRIDVDGRGAREPIDPGSDLRARRANRRLQVVVNSQDEKAASVH